MSVVFKDFKAFYGSFHVSWCDNYTFSLFVFALVKNAFPAFPSPELESVQIKELFFLKKLHLQFHFNYLYSFLIFTAQKVKFSIQDFFSKCDQIANWVTFTEEILIGKLHLFILRVFIHRKTSSLHFFLFFMSMHLVVSFNVNDNCTLVVAWNYSVDYQTGESGSMALATSKMELFLKIVNAFQPLTTALKCSILDIEVVLDLTLITNVFSLQNFIN